MTHTEAIECVKSYTRKNLLESLELIKAHMESGIRMPTDVRVAYYTLMAAFTRLMG